MKYCQEYAALLDPFVDGELPPEELERVREHLENCPGCRAYVDDAMTIRANFPDVEETVVPEDFAEGVMERIRASKHRPFRRWIGTAAALAACCALVVLARTGTGGSPAAPAGGVMSSVYGSAADAGGVDEASIAPQAEEPMESARMYAADTAAEAAEEDIAVTNAEGRQEPAAAAAPKMEAQSDAADDQDIALCLTAREAGSLLDGFTPEEESASERRYTLSLGEYEALLEALGRWEKLPDTPEMRFQVVVTGPF